MANHVSHGSLPYPIKNARYTVLVPYLDADGDPTDPTTPDTELSGDAGAFADMAEEVTTISGSNGVGYITLTGAETNYSLVAMAAKVASGPKATLLTLNPRALPTISSGTLSAGSAGGGTLGTILAYDITGCFVRTTGGTGGGGTGGENNQARQIVTYTISTGAFTVVPNWETTPDATTTYDVLLPDGLTLGVLKALNPTTAGRTLDVSTGGEAGVDWANVGSPTTTLALTGTTIATTQQVDVNTIKTQTVTASGGVTFPAATLASTTNITAGTITTATNVTTVNGLAAGVITAASIATDAIDADALADGAITAATFAAGAIDATAIASNAITSAKIATDAIGADQIAADAIGSSELAASAVTEIQSGLSTLTAAAAADAVWDEALAGHLGVGSTGEALNASGSAGDPWSTALPGAYGAGSAGKIIGDNINATISSRATQTSVDDVPTNAELATALGTADDAVLAAIAALNNLSAAQVNAEVVDALATDTYAEPGQGAPSATTSLAAKINYLYKSWRNKKDGNGMVEQLYADNGTTVDQKATVAESAGVVTKSEVVSGP